MRWMVRRLQGDRGVVTAEYAVASMTACAFAAVLYKILTGGSVLAALTKLIQSALAVDF